LQGANILLTDDGSVKIGKLTFCSDNNNKTTTVQTFIRCILSTLRAESELLAVTRWVRMVVEIIT